MALDPSPLSARPTPLLPPTDPVPGRGSALVGGIIAVILAVVIAVVATKAGTALLYLPQGFNAQAQAVVNQLPQVQGFNYYWTKSYDTGGVKGYDNTTANQHNLTDEAQTYHMNLAVITVTANQDTATGTTVFFNSSNDDTYGDATYAKLANAAFAAGLTPIFRLSVHVIRDPSNDLTSTKIGSTWQTADFSSSVAPERAWFDSYTAFVVHYAQFAQSLGMPMMIIGEDLSGITSDIAYTGATTKAKTGLCNDKSNPSYGRRDCEWRHVVKAIRGTTYTPLGGGKSLPGGGFTGALTFAATVADSAGQAIPEWQAITWWDALDVIGIDAFFRLTLGGDVSVGDLVQAWNGNPPEAIALSPAENIVKDLEQLSIHFQRRVLFTGAGYESITGANNNPGKDVPLAGTTQDSTEQGNDMQALLQAFQNQTWWLGVIWSSDYPVSPRSGLTYTAPTDTSLVGLSEYQWALNTEWAGDCVTGCANPEKGGGAVLRAAYTNAPLTVIFWQQLLLTSVG
jgi:hypothetical protein